MRQVWVLLAFLFGFICTLNSKPELMFAVETLIPIKCVVGAESRYQITCIYRATEKFKTIIITGIRFNIFKNGSGTNSTKG